LIAKLAERVITTCGGLSVGERRGATERTRLTGSRPKTDVRRVNCSQVLPRQREQDAGDEALSAFRFGALVANISKLFRPLEKPSLAGLPFFVGRRWVDQTIHCLACHLSCLCSPLGTRACLLRPRRMQRRDDRLAVSHTISAASWSFLPPAGSTSKITLCVFSQVGHQISGKRCSVSMRRPCLPYLRLCSWGPNTGNPA
jgi:hypothetical protein